jgi:hypothetical protein
MERKRVLHYICLKLHYMDRFINVNQLVCVISMQIVVYIYIFKKLL